MSAGAGVNPSCADVIGPGTAVRIRDHWPEASGPVHIRTPHYLRGRRGTVVRYLGEFRNPEDLAFVRPAALVPLYHVAFDGRAVWPEATADEVVAEIFEHWLEPA